MNSFKGRFFISDMPFKLPSADTFVGFDNYISGVQKTKFFHAFWYTFFITVSSVFLIIIFDSLAAWSMTRIKTLYTKMLLALLVFSMVVPFQMVMFTMAKTANFLHIDNLIGIPFIYLGFGSGLSVFMYSGFVKSVPLEIEESALIDGCSPLQVFSHVVFPILKPISVTVAILNTMWIWNDYLLPFLIIGNRYRTLSIAVQYLQGGYGSRDMGAMMAVLVMTIVPVIVFYLTCQKYIIHGIVSGAVKG
jgi:raffinose/stachyose/melibiose transport system permease protein